MIRITISLIIVFALGSVIKAQTCGQSRTLSAEQKTQISAIVSSLDAALQAEDLFWIDSLSTALKNAYSSQGGLPDVGETYYALIQDSNWPDITNAVLLSRQLVDANKAVYVDLWKAAKGMKPSLYQPHSLFLRASAEIASGLLKIANNEPDETRKALYQLWATRALDSLATMQLPSGAFPFPDLRPYGDPVFSPIIKKFIDNCGVDSVNVLQNGWIVDDKGSGEFKFDAGVIANAFYEAYTYTGNTNYKNIAITVGNYLLPLKFNVNYNYNTFVSLGLTRAFELTKDSSYLKRAIANLRYAVYPGQLTSGRWVDGHNANPRYHSIIIQNSVPTIALLPASNAFKSDLENMAYKAIKNIVEHAFACNASTGFRWLVKAYGLNATIIPPSLKDSMDMLLGKHINQSAINGKYLDVPTMGEYMELYGQPSSLNTLNNNDGVYLNGFPNPTKGDISLSFTIPETNNVVLALYDMNGRCLNTIYKGRKTKGTYSYRTNLSQHKSGVYILTLTTRNRTYFQKILRLK